VIAARPASSADLSAAGGLAGVVTHGHRPGGERQITVYDAHVDPSQGLESASVTMGARPYRGFSSIR
jgi:hypothetical protein